MWTDEITAEVKKLRQDGFSWTHIAQQIKKAYELPDYTESQVIRKARHIAKAQKPDRPSSKRYSADGSVESVCLIELWDKDSLTPDEILTFHHLDPKRWEIVSCKNNIWNAQDKVGRVQMYQSKVSAKPRKVEITLDDIDLYFKSKVYSKPEIIPLQYDASGETLEICLPDLHVGLLAWAQETGADYDIHIARQAFMTCMSDIVLRCQGRAFKRIYLVTLGDLLHIDNDLQTTSKGTFQQADGRMAKIFNSALDMLIDALDLLGSLAPVETVYLSGNHDRQAGYMVIKALEMAYRKDTNFTFDTAPNPMKHRLIDVSLVGWTHGSMYSKNLGEWLPEQARKEYGQAKFVEVHAGHTHIESTKERYVLKAVENTVVYPSGGVIVRSLPRISNSSYWEHEQGYPQGTKTLMCFVWHEQQGLRETWYSNL